MHYTHIIKATQYSGHDHQWYFPCRVELRIAVGTGRGLSMLAQLFL